MKAVKFLDRVQAVKLLFINFILAAIQEHDLKSELACLIHTNNTKQFAAQLVIHFLYHYLFYDQKIPFQPYTRLVNDI
jgi:hypothetical protein